MTQPRLADPATSRAVLVGTHDYAALEQLPAVRRNLEELSRLLRDPRYWGLPAENCVVLEQPGSADAVLDVLSHAAEEATDTLLVYFAGHGLVDHLDDSFHLALAHTRPDRIYTALRYEDVRRVFRAPSTRAPRKVLIMDCCFSGRAMHGAMGAPDRAAQVAVLGTSVLTATAETRRAAAPPGEEFTAFTGELIKCVTEGVENDSELVDMGSLYLELYRRLAAQGRELPQQSNRNTAAGICVLRNAARVPVLDPVPARGVTGAEGARSGTSDGAGGSGTDRLVADFAEAARQIGLRYGPAGLADRPTPSEARDVDRWWFLRDAEQQAGTRLAGALLERVADEAHDGTATAVLLADATASRARESVLDGECDPLTLLRELVREVTELRQSLRSSATPIKHHDQLMRLVATATDEATGRLIANALDSLSPTAIPDLRVRLNPTHRTESVNKAIAVASDALRHGVVPGGGAAYLRLRAGLPESGSPAQSVLSAALAAPALQLLASVGGGPSLLPALTERALAGQSYDIVRGTYASAKRDEQLIDSVHVLDVALEEATRTVASLLLPMPGGS
ncbi:caspase family protein [Embleya sp. NBC_00896]|uniref:caspase, EACC1-associated type n=1 Tax=Embleya sp. NBC_00896 TaxID=2975961 RepID=UPI00386C76D2|nr:caspase family protein [Embleya sp. NBC_00896]